jgi:hypothetical protein
LLLGEDLPVLRLILPIRSLAEDPAPVDAAAEIDAALAHWVAVAASSSTPVSCSTTIAA